MNLDPQAIAVLALATCCHDHEGNWNNCVVMVIAVVQFLKETVGDPGTQALHDQAGILRRSEGQLAIKRWMESQRFN
jgi:hypothetical protein